MVSVHGAERREKIGSHSGFGYDKKTVNPEDKTFEKEPVYLMHVKKVRDALEGKFGASFDKKNGILRDFSIIPTSKYKKKEIENYLKAVSILRDFFDKKFNEKYSLESLKNLNQGEITKIVDTLKAAKIEYAKYLEFEKDSVRLILLGSTNYASLAGDAAEFNKERKMKMFAEAVRATLTSIGVARIKY